MKQLIRSCMVIIFLAFPFANTFAQYVTIPDTSFRKFLLMNYPTAMVGNQLDTTHPSVLNALYMTCDSLQIRDLEGIQYFDNLLFLNCSYNLIRSFTSLPPNLVDFDCHTNNLDSLPDLPATLETLNCLNNNLKKLPALPPIIKSILCNRNNIDSLQPLPVSVQNLHCGNNQLSVLPLLPPGLLSLNCDANQLSTLPPLTSALENLSCSFNPLYTLGALPASLKSLSCRGDSLSILPALPAGLGILNCGMNQLSVLPTLPLTLNQLVCDFNLLTALPVLPPNLTHLYCPHNALSTLPTLPLTLFELNCGYNLIPFLPVLPTGLSILDYSQNPITTLPTLPGSLKRLTWNQNSTPVLPALPASLEYLECNSSDIDSLPVLPMGLLSLECQNDSLSLLPSLPASLRTLNFNNNLMSTMPVLPPNLLELQFSYNSISLLSWIPSSTIILNCSYNPALNCLPKLNKVMFSLLLDGTAIACMPNYVELQQYGFISPIVYSMPLCTPATGCPCHWNISGNVHSDTSINCTLDSLFPGPRVQHVKVDLFKNGAFIDDLYITQLGGYSFDTGNNDTLEVKLHTANQPFSVLCPGSVSHMVILTPSDSMKDDVSFGVECNGIDAGVRSINGRFRPATVTHLNILAGSMAEFFNIKCTTPYSATVTTILNGPVTYLMPSGTALTPSVVSGNVITYYVPDMSLIDVYTAFGIDVLTDTSAVIGNEVCITVSVSNVLADVNLTNNTMHFCIPVVNSFDPNAKLVYPTDDSKPGDELTYTIQFQNTGSDTAYRVVIRDTLHDNLDISTFNFMASSHPVEFDINGNVLSFYFNDINLLDSVHHEPQSHGWLQFKIKLKSNLPFGTSTPNLAAIYFDFNPPIHTDTAINFIGKDPTYTAPADPVKFPNAITPNGDGLNDTWHILNNDFLMKKQIEVLEVVILNRWGQKVGGLYGTNGSWKAYEVRSSDVFTYHLRYKTRSGNIRTQRGEIIVIK